MCTEKYVNPFTDFGFKLLFGTPANKEFLITFLNSLIDLERPIVDISYNNTEIFGKTPDDRKAVYDLYCTTDNGAHVIVEMQNAYQRYFLDRTVYYSTFPIQAVARRGTWDYRLPPVYTIAFLNFNMSEFVGDPRFKHVVRLQDIETHHTIYDKLTYIYLEMPKFNKEIDSLNGFVDCWLYVIKNLEHLDSRPEALRDKVFKHFFRVAEIARFTPEERVAYEASLKSMRDYNNTIQSAEEKGHVKGKAEGIAEGIAKGRAEGRAEGGRDKAIEIARRLKAMGASTEMTAEASGLSEAEIAAL